MNDGGVPSNSREKRTVDRRSLQANRPLSCALHKHREQSIWRMAQAMALPSRTAKSGLSRYLEEIKRFPMLEPQEEFMLRQALAGAW